MWNIRRVIFDDIYIVFEYELCCGNKGIIILLLFFNIEVNRIINLLIYVIDIY